MTFAFARPAALLLLLMLPALYAILRYGDQGKRAALQRFGITAHAAKRTAQRALLFGAILLLIVAIAQPIWRAAGSAAPPRSADIVFLLDVSRSMMTGDVQPMRIARAKTVIDGIIRRMSGERVGLVTFAGSSSVQCPLTIDYTYFRQRLAAASMDSVTRGGTRIGDALTFAPRNAFDDVENAGRNLVLVTDGGDQDSNPEGAAASLASLNIRLVVVGVGDQREGGLVPISDTDRVPFIYDGHPVATKLEKAALQRIALASFGGAYLDLSALEAGRLPAWVSRKTAGRQEHEDSGYSVLAACALLLLAAEFLMSNRKAPLAAVLMLLAPLGRSLQKTSAEPVPIPAKKEDVPFGVSDWASSGVEAYRLKNYSEAARDFASASDLEPRSPEILLDLASALYREERYAEAKGDFEKAESLARDERLKAKAKLGAADCAARMVRGREAFEIAQGWMQVLGQYREVQKMDPRLEDARYNIEVVKRKLQSLKQEMGNAARNYMLQSAADVAREKNTSANDILKEDRLPGDPNGLRRRVVDKDW